jgi:hypothetical protein
LLRFFYVIPFRFFFALRLYQGDLNTTSLSGVEVRVLTSLSGMQLFAFSGIIPLGTIPGNYCQTYTGHFCLCVFLFQSCFFLRKFKEVMDFSPDKWTIFGLLHTVPRWVDGHKWHSLAQITIIFAGQ